MAPIKFEENIKDKLEKRSIQPSTDAWDKLSANLNANDKKNKRGFIFYVGIAASIIGVLLVTTVMFKSAENQIENPILVNTNSNTSPIKVKGTNNETITKEEVTKISEENIDINRQHNNSSINNEPKLATTLNQPSKRSVKNNTDKILNENRDLLSETKQSVAHLNSVNHKKQESAVSSLSFEELKAVEVVNQIKNLEIKNGVVTDAEIENLLKQAERDILRERIYNKTTKTVDADALLQDVEDDLEQSFRTRVFEGLKSRLKSFGTAVAERNN
nr:hypothetical protein [uncultured Psychroserpens sp.]